MRWRPGPVTAVAVPFAMALVGNLATSTIDVDSRWWPPAVWTAVGVLVVVAVASELTRIRPAAVPLSGPDEWADGLAQAIQEFWRREEEHRRIHDPVALPVRWHLAADSLADHWANVRRLPVGAAAGPLAMAGHFKQVVDVYRRIPSGRLVILGKAGAGKTVLAARLTLDLLASRQPGQPVPVIVSIGSWNPTTTPLHTWMAGQLTRDHPGLAVPAVAGGPDGPSRAAALVTAGKILPILDGFDEIPLGLHRAAMHHLNTTPDTPIVLTSRPDEYTTAVIGTDVLTAAAVIELADLTLDDLNGYLPRTAAGPRTGMWDPILARMHHEPTAPGPATLRHVLTNPLMVFLARTTYSDIPGHDPTELLDPTRFATPEAVQEHLLAAFVPAVYQQHHHQNAHRWDLDRAHRYLTYLAHHLHHAGTRDLAWWQLRDTLSTRVRLFIFPFMLTLGAVLASGLTSGLVLGFVYGFAAGPLAWPLAGLVVGGLVGILVWGTTGMIANTHDREGLQPARTRLQVRGRVRDILGRLGSGFAVGTSFGPMILFWFGSATGYEPGSETGYVALLAFGFAAILVFGFAFGLAFGFDVPIDASDVVNASESLASDRRNTIRRAITAGLTLGLAGGLVFGVAFGLRAGLIGGFTGGVVGIAGGIAVSAWGHWLVLVRVWLPLTGRLPWRVHAFLTDAYCRGVLRQTGAVYQFRHARLQDHLITYRPAG